MIRAVCDCHLPAVDGSGGLRRPHVRGRGDSRCAHRTPCGMWPPFCCTGVTPFVWLWHCGPLRGLLASEISPESRRAGRFQAGFRPHLAERAVSKHNLEKIGRKSWKRARSIDAWCDLSAPSDPVSAKRPRCAMRLRRAMRPGCAMQPGCAMRLQRTKRPGYAMRPRRATRSNWAFGRSRGAARRSRHYRPMRWQRPVSATVRRACAQSPAAPCMAARATPRSRRACQATVCRGSCPLGMR